MTKSPVMAHSRSPSISSSPNTTNGSSSTNPDSKTLRPYSKHPIGLSKAWGQIEMLFSYVWLLIQILLLIAGLTVLNFATLMVVLSYCIYGYFKPRQEFLPYKLD